jgi:hypothetical protein
MGSPRWQADCSVREQTVCGGQMKKAKSVRTVPAPTVVDFAYDNMNYQIDTQRRKVYRKWVEVESARTYLIMSAWSSLNPKKAV